ncbi:MAG: hypothetical protein IPL53_14930 [Ignavibacteria bacterium]|nr:hypothetical protein [Ignavibacteria bacterium]
MNSTPVSGMYWGRYGDLSSASGCETTSWSSSTAPPGRANTRFTYSPATFVFDLTASIEGFYDPNSNSMISDTITVYLRSSDSPFPKIDSAKTYLNSSGQASFDFNNISNNTGYYIQIKHRNGLETWSSTVQSFTSNRLGYDFTDNSTKAYGDNLKQAGTKWVIYTGDVSQDGIIDLTDVIDILNNAAEFISSYVSTDVNGDNFTDLEDVLLAYNNSTCFVEKSSP